MQKLLIVFLTLLVVISVPTPASVECRVSPHKVSVAVNEWPPSGPGGKDRMVPIAGVVSALKPEKCKLAVFAYSDMWYIQPSAQAPLTPVEADGTWRTRTHFGSRYAVLVVEPGYRPPAKSEWTPPVGGAVIVTASSTEKKTKSLGKGTLSDHFPANHARMTSVIQKATEAGVQKVVFLKVAEDSKSLIVFNTAGRVAFTAGRPEGMEYLEFNKHGIELLSKRLARANAGLYSDDVLYILWPGLESNYVQQLR